jgi:hypothetical protein
VNHSGGIVVTQFVLPTIKGMVVLKCAIVLFALGNLVQGQQGEPIQNALEPAAIPPEQFTKLHRLIKPQPGELRFREIPWLIDVWEARKLAAAEGKPILVWSGAGGAPIGIC